MFILTTVQVNATSDTSNNKYMERYNIHVGALNKYFYHLKQAFINLVVITAPQCKEVRIVSPNESDSSSASA